ncbi:RNA polymerase Rpb4, partial [Verticillium dahliae]
SVHDSGNRHSVFHNLSASFTTGTTSHLPPTHPPAISKYNNHFSTTNATEREPYDTNFIGPCQHDPPPPRDGATRLPTSSQHRPSNMADQGDSTLIPPRKQERKRFKPTSRPRPPIPGQEKAEAVLELGEFQEVDTLTLSEASLVINALVTKRRMDRKNVNETEMLTQTLNYLDAFSRFRQKENVEAVERLLSAHKQLAKFERAQIGSFLFPFIANSLACPSQESGSLCCETAEEAKTLIPSLQDKITDEDLQELLDEISKLQSR